MKRIQYLPLALKDTLIEEKGYLVIELDLKLLSRLKMKFDSKQMFYKTKKEIIKKLGKS
jgi:hypothetical protein